MAKAKRKATGYIVKSQTPSKEPTRWHVVIQHGNGNKADYSRYETASGRNKKVIRLKEKYPNYKVVTKAELKLIQKAKKKK